VALLSWLCAVIVGWGAQDGRPLTRWVRRALWAWAMAAAVWWGADVVMSVIQTNVNNAAWAHTMAAWWWSLAWLGAAVGLMAWLWRTRAAVNADARGLASM
jgi:glucan phosphoethanolaminetransferase (alkaline phosphatase superfamily)